MIIDLAAIRAGIGPARLLDMVEGRSKQGFTTWLSEREPAWRGWVEVVAMDGFTGFKTATTETLPDAVAVMDPSTGSAGLHWHRGRRSDPFYKSRRTLLPGADYLTENSPGRAVRRR